MKDGQEKSEPEGFENEPGSNAERVYRRERIHQRVPPGTDGKRPGFDRLLEGASDVVRRKKETAGNVEPAEGYKRGQIEALKKYASDNDLWIEDIKSLGKYLAEGGENEVYAKDDEFVYKLNNFEYAGDDLDNFFDRIDAHNVLFSNVPYRLVGFSENRSGEFSAVLEQPFIQVKREAAPDEIVQYMNSLGFENDGVDEFLNERYKVFDAVPNNVLVGNDDTLYFIDTQIKK